MSFDNQDAVSMGNFDPTPAKSGGKKWILLGCGCAGLLGLIGLLAIGGVVWFAFNTIEEVKQEAKSFVEASAVVQQHLGNPVTVGEGVLTEGVGGAPAFVFDVSGPEGSGTVKAVSEQVAGEVKFVISKYTLNFDGQEFNLDPEDGFKMDLEGMDEF